MKSNDYTPHSCDDRLPHSRQLLGALRRAHACGLNVERHVLAAQTDLIALYEDLETTGIARLLPWPLRAHLQAVAGELREASAPLSRQETIAIIGLVLEHIPLALWDGHAAERLEPADAAFLIGTNERAVHDLRGADGLVAAVDALVVALRRQLECSDHVSRGHAGLCRHATLHWRTCDCICRCCRPLG